MKFLGVALVAASVVWGAELKDVKSVYIFPMSAGMDQHLANRITQDHIFRVVADPKVADAVITESLGANFEYKLERIHKPKPAAAAPAPATPPAAAPASPAPAAAVVEETEPHASSFTRGKGTLFLVDPTTRVVLWSAFQKPKNTTPKELEKAAKRVTAGLALAMK